MTIVYSGLEDLLNIFFGTFIFIVIAFSFIPSSVSIFNLSLRGLLFWSFHEFIGFLTYPNKVDFELA